MTTDNPKNSQPTDAEITAIYQELVSKRLDDEVIQETIVRLLERWDKIDNPRHWAMKTAYNVKYEILRAESKRVPIDIRKLSLEPAPDISDDFDNVDLKVLFDIVPEWKDLDIANLTEKEVNTLRRRAKRYWERKKERNP